MAVQVRFLGTGNTFAAGGRSNSCILLTAPEGRMLLDCGASALPAITKVCDPTSIDAVAISHLHGDHVGGLPYLALHQKWAPRSRPLNIAGPPSLETWFALVAPHLVESLFDSPLPYSLVFSVLGSTASRLGPAMVSAHPVVHVASAEPHGFRVHIGGRLIAYSGDTTWCDALPSLADGADLFICEATPWQGRNPVHLSVQELVSHRDQLHCERLIATHLDASSLAHLDEFDDLRLEYAVDGMTIEL